VISGRDRYAEARRRALARTGDPQAARSARAAELTGPGRPCRCTGDDPVPHSGYLHHLTDSGRRTWCSIAAAAGRCRCEGYDPRSK
jgi:hypothetical protein